MLKKASYIGYTAFLATGPAILTACSNAPVAEQPQEPSVLFSLTSDAMHFENPDGMNVTLVMEGVDPHTIWFTDRPARESGAIATSRFAQDWQSGGTFDIDPPNAALVLHESTKVDSTTTDTLVVEVQDASYDEANRIFRADLKVLLDQEAATTEGNLSAHGDRHDNAWPSRAGAVSLFIDSVSLDSVLAEATPAPSSSNSSSLGASSPAAAGASSSAPNPNSSSSSAVASPSGSASTASLPPGSQKIKPMIKLCSTPSTCNNSTSANYTYNSTIYFKVTIQENVTLERFVVSPSPLRMD